MNCPNCQTANPAGAKFCSNCGTRLAPPAPTAPTLQGERRVVTILFCDVSGSTAMAEGMDPEEWTGIMNRAFNLLMEPVNRYGGTVARLMGDAILAFFGAPTAHEDDAQRAVLAGLDILSSVVDLRQQLQRRYDLDFNVRVGINTGLVVVGQVGSDLKTEYTAMGDAVNLAARMEQTAAPGTVQIAEDTYKQVAALFEFQPLGRVEVKGKREPVAAYRVLRKKEGAVAARGIAGLRSPMVGREEELARLQSGVRALLQGQGQVVSIIGEAGLGKSRLLAETRHWLADQDLLTTAGGTGAPLAWFQGRSLSYQANMPYAPFIDLLRGAFSLSGGPDAPREAAALDYSTLKDRLAETSDHPEEIAPYLAALLGVEVQGEDAQRIIYLSPPQLRERIFHAVADWLECLAARQKVLLVFEDLHWADAASLELIERLLPLTGRLPILLVALFRPNRQDLSWQFHQAAERDDPDRYTALTLQPLDGSQAAALIANLLEIEDLPETVRQLILRKAEGNPFFVEEVIRSLLDAGLVVREGGRWRATREIEDIAIPDTLAGVITARLDRLDGASRQVTQEASVIGREFRDVVLQTLHRLETPGEEDGIAEALEVLQQRELIREENRAPFRVYVFKHVLTQEAAYRSLLNSRRRALHRSVAEYLVQTAPEQAGEIAHHFWEAQEPLQALPYLVRAGEQAVRTYATTDAIHYFNRALEVVAAPPDAAEPAPAILPLARQAYEGLGRALTFANRVADAVENYQQMQVYASRQGDIPMQVSALNKLSEIVSMRLGQFPEAEKMLSDAETLARQSDDKPGLAEMFIIRCGLCTAHGDFAGAVNYLGGAVQIAREMDQKVDTALGLAHIANTQIWMTQFDNAWQTAQQSLKISREVGNRELQAEVLAQCLPLYHMHTGDYPRALATAEEGARLAAQIGASLPEALGSFIAGRMALETGDYEKAIAWEQQAVQAGEAFGMPFPAIMGLCALGTAFLEISPVNREKTIEAHAKALEMFDLPGGVIAGGMGWLDLGFCALALGDDRRAEEYFQKGLNIPTPQVLLMRPYHLCGMAAVACVRGEFAAAQEHLDLARGFAEEKGMKHYGPLLHLTQGRIFLQDEASPGQAGQALAAFDRAAGQAAAFHLRPLLWQAHAGAARALSLLGREPEAAQRMEQARAVIREIAALFSQEEYRAAYLENMEHRLRPG